MTEVYFDKKSEFNIGYKRRMIRRSSEDDLYKTQVNFKVENYTKETINQNEEVYNVNISLGGNISELYDKVEILNRIGYPVECIIVRKNKKCFVTIKWRLVAQFDGSWIDSSEIKKRRWVETEIQIRRFEKANENKIKEQIKKIIELF